MAVTIPQRELRNNVSDVLRRAEQGERFTITVSGRPVAELGPPAQEPRGTSVAELWRLLLETPADPSWAEDLKRMREADRANARDPWAG
jgi:prevent-host-death family protein